MKAKAPKAAKAPPAVDPIFAVLLRGAGLPMPTPEHRFHPDRKWRFDFSWPDHKVALEVEGGVWSRGRHTRPKGFIRDIEKYNAAAAMGWRVLRCQPETLHRDETLELIGRSLSPADPSPTQQEPKP